VFCWQHVIGMVCVLLAACHRYGECVLLAACHRYGECVLLAACHRYGTCSVGCVECDRTQHSQQNTKQ